jgi:hypothetical protein
VLAFADDPPGLLTVGTSLEENELWSLGGVAMLPLPVEDMIEPGSIAFSEIYLRSME